MKSNLSDCPACGKKMIITSYECPSCHVEVRGKFKPGKLASLSKEQQEFVEIFMMKRGNLKEVEKTLGISYPTVRNRLDEVIRALGHKVDTDRGQMEILEMIESGHLSVEEGEQMLKDWGQRHD